VSETVYSHDVDDDRMGCPPLPKERREVLGPLTSHQLVLCCRVAIRDWHQHIEKEHPVNEAQWNINRMLVNILEHLLEKEADPRKAAECRRLRRSIGIGEVQEEEDAVDLHELGMRLASDAVSKYWAHVTEGHSPPGESETEYLLRIVERVRRPSPPVTSYGQLDLLPGSVMGVPQHPGEHRS
jgi:hypothetical protein